ncbi:MAG: polysaccharide biosynthesis C-terminal domain-containing protein [Calothrix sp. MO_167.B12]|nr:polysaccharide biosynthesis C-terminal domain-containing protein [Calothrix sp. MO_167.B12]
MCNLIKLEREQLNPHFIVANPVTESMYRIVIGRITNVLLNLFLIPTYGAISAAIATVISYAFSGFFMNATHPKTRKIFQIQIKSFLPLRS